MSSCHASLADANIAVVAGATIELCPGTYKIGTPLDDTFTTFVGGQPLIVDQTGVTVKCGTNGASTNNCILDGGFAQLLLSCDDCTFQGLTFTGQMESTSAVSDGSLAPRNVFSLGTTTSRTFITFDDCVFENINSTGYIMDIRPEGLGTNPGGTAKVIVTNCEFSNIAHSFDVINTDPGTLISFNTVSFDNVTHQPPEEGVDQCSSSTSRPCSYSSSIIHIGNTDTTQEGFPTSTLAESYISVSVSNSEFYTSIIRTVFDWGGPKTTVNFPFTTLISSTNNTVYNQENRTANDDYCEGGYAAEYNAASLIDWSCKRVDYSYIPVAELLRCGYHCDANGNFSTLLEALEKADLTSALVADPNNVTIFAPTNAAFELLPPGMLDDLMDEDVDTLKSLLLYHVTVEDDVDTSAIAFGLPSALTAQGESVSFTPASTTTHYKVDGANIIQADWDETPGGGKVIQVLDRVINPSTIPILPSFSQLVESLNLTLFIEAAAQVEFNPDLDGDKKYSIFAPSNAAITNSSIAQTLLASGDDKELTKMLNHHVIEGTYTIADLQASNCQELTSLADLTVKVTFSSGEVKWNDDFTNTSVVDQIAYNGILHVVNGLMDINNIKTCTTTITTVSSGRAGSVAMSMVVGLVGTVLAMIVL